MKKIFGKLKLNWLMVIIGAIVIGCSVGLINCVPVLLDTSFRDPAIYFSFWILCGILIIMNSKNNLDSALKCFVFFLISQPLIYLVEVPFVSLHWGIFTYYKPWLIMTFFCFPMGYIGYYIKKNKWWGLFILLPMMMLLAYESTIYLGGLIYAFPHHLLSYLFSIASIIIYPYFIFDDKKIRKIGLIIGIILIAIAIVASISNKNTHIYETDIMCDTEEHPVNDEYKAYLRDKEYGDLSIIKRTIGEGESKEVFYCIHAEFKKAGKTTLVVESPDGKKKTYDITIKNKTYSYDEVK